MKILRITVNNIASLAGTQTVDFTQDPLRSAGLYSISGATGAGKSTLLDALCLALYDRTPRLQGVGRLDDLRQGERQNDTRSLLRRGAIEGLAEVAFVGVDEKSWTARWSVRRSHRKADGNLQAVEMALYAGHITPCASGPVDVGGKKTAVLEAIETKIGLTFEQFTRAVLLAQNDFAAFLKADDKQRAEILQALTGTELFEDISKEIYRRSAEEKKSCESLESMIEGNAPLTIEERTAAESILETASIHLVASETKLKKLDDSIAWFRGRSKLQNEFDRANEGLLAADQRNLSAANQRLDLQWTETISREARSLRVAQQSLAKIVNERNHTYQQSLVDSKKNDEELHKRAEGLVNATAKLRRARTEQTVLTPLVVKARELDARLEPASLLFKNAKRQLLDAKESYAKSITPRNRIKAKRDKLQQELDSFNRMKDALKQWFPLAKEASKWTDRIDQMIDSNQNNASALCDVETSCDAYTESKARLSDKQKKVSSHDQIVIESQRSYEELLAATKQFDPDQIAIDRQQAQLSERTLSALKTQLHEIDRSLQTASELNLELSKLAVDQTRDQSTLVELSERELPNALKAVEVARQLLEAIQAAVDDAAKRLRLMLQDGKACPVCGSTEHPFGNHPPDADMTAIKAIKKSIKQLEKQRDTLQVQKAELDVAIQNRSQRLLDAELESKSLLESVEKVACDSQEHVEVAKVLELPSDERSAATGKRLIEVRELLERIASYDKAYRDTAKQLTQHQVTLDEARGLATNAAHVLSEAEKEFVVVEQHYLQSKEAHEKYKKTHEEILERLSDVWVSFPHLKQNMETDTKGFRQLFVEKITCCSRIECDIQETQTQLQGTEFELYSSEENLRNAEHLVAKYEVDFQSAKDTFDGLMSERLLVLDGMTVLEVEEAMAARFVETECELERLTKEKNEADRMCATSTANVTSASIALNQTEEAFKQSQSMLNSWIAQFASTTSRWLSMQELDSVLERDEAWIRAQRDILKKLDEDVDNARGALDVYRKQLEQHLNSCPTQSEEVIVIDEAEAARIVVQNAKESQENARVILRGDDERRRSNIEVNKQLDAQRLVAEPWWKLNDFVGSADGAKFRTIAQRRTLDMLLRYANHQLQQLAVRYRLERLPESLNLIVIDRDMEDERRSIHSLSGGESFLVSLALALGLASLTSNRVRIESLFIDEGFGSLDPETLNTVMGGLMQLESQGRKVGVISHVAEMTEAISVQVKVVKGRGGKSYIEIPGVSV